MDSLNSLTAPSIGEAYPSRALVEELEKHNAGRKKSGMVDDGFDVNAARKALGPSTRALPAGIAIEKGIIGDVPYVRATPAETEYDRLLVYIHGGGYCAGSWESHRGQASWLAYNLKCPVIFPEYRLAPEHPFPTALDDCRSLVATVAEACATDSSGQSLLLAGDSAGAGLCVAVTSYLIEQNKPLPKALALMCGMYDHNPDTADYLLKFGRAREMAALYVSPEESTNPYASPVRADLKGFPPILVQSGGADYVKDDSIRLVKRAFECDVTVMYEHWPKLPHVWQRFVPDVPEARVAIERAASFLASSCE